MANLARRTRVATLGKVTPLDRFDWSHPQKLERDLYERLMKLDFIGQTHNVLFRGPSGVGKTTLAQNLGLRALEQGYTVRFATLASVHRVAGGVARPRLPHHRTCRSASGGSSQEFKSCLLLDKHHES